VTSDEQLVEQALAGSALAFAELVDRYQDRLLRFLLARAASRPDAEDAVQDTFISAYRYLHSYNPKWRFSTWIYRIAIRNAVRQPDAEQLDAGDVEDRDAADPLQACIDAAERDNAWLTAKRVLSDEAYAAMWLRYAEDLSIREVAQALDRTQSWAKVTLLRGRRALGEALSEAADAADRRENYGRI